MTVVGKILVFLNLVFSIVVGGFVVATYIARTHWAHEYKALSDQNKVLAASEQTFKNEADKAKQVADATVAQMQVQLKKVRADLQVQRDANADMSKDLEKLKQTSTQQGALASLSGVEVQKRQEDVSKLRDTLKKETDLNNALVKKNNELLDQATAATIEKQAVLARNKNLEEQLQQVARDLARMRASGGSTTLARAGAKNPPTESVEGLIKTTDPSSGLMTITIGSDAGLVKGNTLEVFRLSSIPSRSKYLGTIRILEATATQAVAQPVGRMAAPPQPGDRVASRIF